MTLTNVSQSADSCSDTMSESESPLGGPNFNGALAQSSSPPHLGNSREQLTDGHVDCVHTVQAQLHQPRERMVEDQGADLPAGLSNLSLAPTTTTPSPVDEPRQ